MHIRYNTHSPYYIKRIKYTLIHSNLVQCDCDNLKHLRNNNINSP